MLYSNRTVHSCKDFKICHSRTNCGTWDNYSKITMMHSKPMQIATHSELMQHYCSQLLHRCVSFEYSDRHGKQIFKANGRKRPEPQLPNLTATGWSTCLYRLIPPPAPLTPLSFLFFKGNDANNTNKIGLSWMLHTDKINGTLLMCH